MKWEVSLLLGFLLFFSIWVSLPATSNFYFDSNNVKHYVLTPALSSYGNDIENLTNVLFIKYDDPWQAQSEIVVLFTGILLLFLARGTVQLYLRNRILTISKFNIQKCFNLFLERCTDLKTTGIHDDQCYISTHFLNNHLFKSYKIKKSKVFPVIFFMLFLFSFFSHDVYGGTAQFSDGGQLTGLSTNCAARSTIGTLSTSLPAASSSTPNIIIATTDYVSTDAGNEQVQTSSGIYRSGSQLVGSQYTFYIGASNEGNHYTYLYEDPVAGASPTYTVEGCLSATAGNAEAKILAIQGLESSFTDSGNVATTAGSFVTVATLTTDLTANNHIVIAQVQIDFDGTATIAAGDIELRDSADTMLAESQFELRGGNNTPGDGSSITLIALVPAGTANTSYKVAVMEPAGGNVLGAEAKILAIKANGGEGYFSDGSSVAVGASATQLTSLTSSFSSNENVVVMSASQFDDTDAVTENLIITSGHELRENSVAKSGNQMEISEPTASGNAGEGIRHALIWYGTVGSASLGYDSRATASATGYNGESKLLAFSIREHLLTSDTPILSESTAVKQKIFPADTPTLSESVTVKQKIFPSDTPTLSDSATASKIYNLSVNDTPSLSDSATAFLNQNVSADDTPTLSDSATASLIQAFTANDTPVLSESIILRQSLFPTDFPTINDLAIAQKQITKRGGGGGDNTPPSIVSSTLTLTGAKSGSVEILGENNNLVNLSEFRPIKVGEAINLRFEINEDGGINNLEHASLYIAKGDSASEVSQSDTFIRFEKGSPFKVSDPDKIFSEVSFAILTKDAGSFVLRFDMTFAKPVEESSVLFRIWDLAKNSNEIWYQNALQVIDIDSSQGPASQESNTNNKNAEPGLKITTDDQKLLVEKWLGYNSESVSDSKLLRLVGIISPETGEEGNVSIQPWFRNNVGKWLFEGRISFTEFVDALDYMYDKGILR
ncbi:MAG: hypothetical protein ACT4N5_06350 [Nitrosopumilaceae archaeon]